MNFEIKSLINPFNDQLSFQMIVPNNDIATITLIDMYGRTIKQEKHHVTQGLNNIAIYDLSSLPAASYNLKIQYEDNLAVRQVVKGN